VVGGRFMNQIFDEIFSINLNNGECIRISKLLFKICAHASILIKDLIYIIGGTDGA